MSELALLGGPKAITRDFPPSRTIGEAEKRVVVEVMNQGCLSGFFASWNDKFSGGPRVQALENKWARLFKTNHAVSFNSWTSGLMAAMGAIGIEPGDEVIVSPWTMCATATAIVLWGGIPVFADIEADTFNIDPEKVSKLVTTRTKAILVTDIFGHSADMSKLIKIAKQYDLKIVEDAAQSPYALYKNKYVGTWADIGGFSLNYHKHIHSGEGGVAVTDDDALAERMRLIRNHAEAVVSQKPGPIPVNMVGFNFRMGEMEAAIAVEQLKKLPKIARARTRAGGQLTKQLSKLAGLTVAQVQPECTHVYYILPMIVEHRELGVSRRVILEALKAEGVPWIYGGYQLIHRLPMYQDKKAFGHSGYPWTIGNYTNPVSYENGICPVAEQLHDESAICLQICQHDYNREQIDAVAGAFHKVWDHMQELEIYSKKIAANSGG
jgi:dTDP-4-amino-4,6-dideoxygalactose transaminase